MTCNCTVVISFFHLKDVGYDGLLPEELGFVNNVINKYFVEYFPRSINTSATLRELGYYEKHIYDPPLAGQAVPTLSPQPGPIRDKTTSTV